MADWLYPIFWVIDEILFIFLVVLIVWVVLSWLIAFNVVNPYNQFVRSLWDLFHKVTEPLLRPIRRFLPDMGGIDIAPVILILVLIFIRIVVIQDWLTRLLS